MRALPIVTAAGLAIAAVLGFATYSFEPDFEAYVLSRGDGEPKVPFGVRRALRSWTSDTADWLDGAAQSLFEAERGGKAPAESVIGAKDGRDVQQVGSAVVIGHREEGHLWLTARHAIADCVAIRIAAGSMDTASALLNGQPKLLHPYADLALIETAHALPEPFEVTIERPGAAVRQAIHVGFPGGRPAAVFSDYLGLTRVRWIDASLPIEAYRVWAERAQIPHFIGGLGGLSGGATLSRNGYLIGTVVGMSERRGRILSTRPAHIALLVEPEPEATDAPATDRFDERSFPVFARELIEQRRIARLNCEKQHRKKNGRRGGGAQVEVDR